MKICQSTFVKDLVFKEKLINTNANVISMKARFAINITEIENYEKANLYIY